MKHVTIACPHCQGNCGISSSRGQTPLIRDIYYGCKNIECGHTFKAQLEIVQTISPSSNPDPRLRIPMAPPPVFKNRPLKPANDDAPLIDRVRA